MTQISTHSIPNEAIGLLGGKKHKGDELLITKMVYVTEGDEVSVSFSEEDFQKFEAVLEDDLYVVGWWHSHPGYGLFLSQTDIETHVYSFQLHNSFSVALVIDPTQLNSNKRAEFQIYQVEGEKGKKPFEYREVASYIKPDS